MAFGRTPDSRLYVRRTTHDKDARSRPNSRPQDLDAPCLPCGHVRDLRFDGICGAWLIRAVAPR